MNHFISLEEATQMTRLYREKKELILKDEFQGKNVLAFNETFDRTAFDSVLKQEGCVGLRIYFGMKEDTTMHVIIVGVNDRNEDIIPSTVLTNTTVDSDSEIIEEGQRCPDYCPPSSPLNS